MRKSVLDEWIGVKTGLAERLEPEALRSWQLARLRGMLGELTRESAFYRRRLAGFNPDALRDFAALERLPFTTADELRLNGHDFVRVSQGEVERIVSQSTSGTSGPAKRLFFTAEDQELTVDFFAVGMREAARPGESVLILMPCATPGGIGDLLSKGLLRLGARPIAHGPARGDAADVAALLAEKPDCIVGLPAQVRRLALLCPQARPRCVLLSADFLPDSVRAGLERIWGCEVFDHYGSTESGYGGGVECAAHSGYHLREADLLLEIVNPDTGRQLPDGETGEVVFSTLTRRAMPLIRYRTGDLARMLPGPCPCGSPLRRLGKAQGRISGRAPRAGGQGIAIHDLDELLFSRPDLLDYSASLRDGLLRIRAEFLNPSATEQALSDLRAFLRPRLGQPFELEGKTAAPGAPVGLKRAIARD